MHRSRDRILTTHVGSLPRNRELAGLLFAKDAGESYDAEAFESCVAREVSAAVARQTSVGIDLVSDGELGKISYATYVSERLSGFDGNAPRTVPQDLEDYPSYLEKLARIGDTPKLKRPCCVAEVTVKDRAPLERDLANLAAAVAESRPTGAFMNAASPGVVQVFQPNQHYPDDDAYLDALGGALREEYEAIVAAGFAVQIDSPDLALGRHMTFKDLSDQDFLRRAERQVEVLNHALAGIPPEKIRMHICWGNYEGPHVHDVPLETIYPVVMKARAQVLLFEASNPRHAHEWQVFRDLGVPEDKVLAPGVIDSTTNFVEHPELVAERICRYADLVGRERVLAGTDCGFATFAGFGKIDPEVCYAKLEALAQGAARASERLW